MLLAKNQPSVQAVGMHLFSRKRIYLDAASSAPVSKAAALAYQKAIRHYGNPSSPHTEGREAKLMLEDARVRIARIMSVKADDVIFTSGATEANTIAIVGHVRALFEQGRAYNTMHVLYAPTAHASVIHAVEHLATLGVATEALVIRDGAIDLTEFKKQLTERTVLVCMDMVCGETGARFDTRGVKDQITKSVCGEEVALHVDASQAPLVEHMERTRVAGDTITLDAQKIGGVRGTGVLIAPRRVTLTRVQYGGGQERGLRPGTEGVAGAVAFAIAFEEAAGALEARVKSWEAMRTLFIARLLLRVPTAHITHGAQQAPHIVNMSFPGLDTDYLVALLDEDGFAVSTKSACETHSKEGSRAVRILTGDTALSAATVRVSWSIETSLSDLYAFCDALMRAHDFMKANERG